MPSFPLAKSYNFRAAQQFQIANFLGKIAQTPYLPSWPSVKLQVGSTGKGKSVHIQCGKLTSTLRMVIARAVKLNRNPTEVLRGHHKSQEKSSETNNFNLSPLPPPPNEPEIAIKASLSSCTSERLLVENESMKARKVLVQKQIGRHQRGGERERKKRTTTVSSF